MRGLDWLLGALVVTSRRAAAIALVAVGVVWVSAASPALALDLLVDTEGDTIAAAFQVCDPSPAALDCSLRGALKRANAVAGPHTITVPPGTYRQTIVNPATSDFPDGAPDDEGLTGDWDIKQNITINGAGSGTTSITGVENVTPTRDRIFDVVLPLGNLTIRDVTIRKGGGGTASNVQGGGVRADGPLTMERVAVRVNEQSIGAGLYIANTAYIRDSAITFNIGQFGAGIWIQTTGSFGSPAYDVSIQNSTISTNAASGTGGGISFTGGNANVVVTLNNVTVASNAAGTTGGGLAKSGAGTLVLRNTIVASNTATTSNPNCSGAIISQGHNLVFPVAATCGFSGTGDITGNPQLGPLQGNGGPTANHALDPLSAARDTGNPGAPGSGGNTCADTDQRGFARPFDGDGNKVARCDIGAYETQTCTTRPNVALGVAPGAPGRITVTVSAGSGNIVELRMHPLPNSNILFNVGAGDQSGELVVPVNAPSKTFTLKRANGTGAGTLPFDVVDGCDVWKTLAGGGPKAWPAGNSGLEAPEPPLSRSEASLPAAQAPAAPPSCAPQRPNAGVSTARSAPGQMQATIVAQSTPETPTNSLRSIRITAITNAAVTLNGSPVSAGQTVTLPDGSKQATLLLDRHAPAQNPDQASGVSFAVTDACGEWPSFVGGGPAAF